MIELKSNIDQAAAKVKKAIAGIEFDKLLRTVAIGMLGEVHDRVHKRGMDASGAAIGTYSSSYLKFRNEGFQSTTVRRGPKKGSPRPVMTYNRGGDSKVILSLSRQMENDMAVMKTNNGYGIGYNNQANRDKVQWIEEDTYKKKILTKLTPAEEKKVVQIAIDFINTVRK